MRFPFRPSAAPLPASALAARLFLLLSYLALSAVPFAPLLLLGRPVEQPWQTLGMEVVAWTAVWAAFKRPAWFHWLLLPAFLALPTELYLFIYYGQGISTHHLGIIAETSPKEAMEFLGSTVYLMAAVLAGVIVWFCACWVVAVKTRALAWQDGSRWTALALVAALAGVAAYGWEFGVAGKPAVKAAAAAPASAARAPAKVAASGFGDGASNEEEEAEEAEASAPASGAVKAAARTGWHWTPLAWWAQVPVDFAAFSNTWPFGLMGRGVDFYRERQHLAELGRTSSSFTFGARQGEAKPEAKAESGTAGGDGSRSGAATASGGSNAGPDTASATAAGIGAGTDASASNEAADQATTPPVEPQVVVMVLGESSRYDRWSLNGYQRETNPLLGKESNLVPLRDVITSVAATRLSVPVIISRKPAMQSLRDGFAEKSFLTAYKEAGFKTYWLSNQISFGQFDTPVSVFAKEADVIQFLNLGGFTNNSNFDQILFDPLKHALADPAPRKLIVLHSLGSHWNYSQRHPKAFDKWQPSLFGIDKPAYTDLKIKPQLNNSYDNSILYTDWFLAQVIAALKEKDLATSMLYVSDHGQTLYDGTCRLAFHGHNTQYEFHVPAFVWYSDQYRQRYPEKVRQLARHRKARLATENMFHTLLDMGDIRYDGERLEWSFLNRKFKQHKRYVDSYGWTNYDNAIIKGDCREVIDRNKPLKQD